MSYQNTSILVVDDEADICEMVSEILKDNGYKVKTALSNKDLIPEDWGGNTQFLPISALKGDGIKKPTESELRNIIAARKSIVAKKKILKGLFLALKKQSLRL